MTRPDVRVSVAVQHHPARLAMLGPLLAALPGAHVVSDPDPLGDRSPWRTYRAALASVPSWATHRVVLQDDVAVCRSFAAAAALTAAARPDDLVALWHGGLPRENLPRIDRARERGVLFAEIATRQWVPAVALLWPAALARSVIEWADRQDWKREPRADDEVLGRAVRDLAVPVLAVVPSLVEHDDVAASTLGQRARAGRDRGRVAHCWIGDGDPLALDWTASAA
jgi:hypothetical protein